jgi:RNA polymerase-binding protein DksA
MAKPTRTTSGRSAAKPLPTARAAAKSTKTVRAATARSAKPAKTAKPVKAAAKTAKTVRPAKAVAAPKKGAAKKVVAKTPAKAAKPAKAVGKAAKKPLGKAAKGGAAAKIPAKAAKATKAVGKAVAKPAKAAAGKAVAGKAAATKAGAGKAVKAKVVKGPPALVPKPAPSRPVLSEVVTRKHRSPAMASSTMERLKVQLIEERGQHVRQMEGLQAEADALANEREPGDTQFDEESGEGDTLSVERERDLALSTAARQTVEDIAKALGRMDDGTYGYCEVCGDRIPVPRLEAIPWADQCVKCKSRGERRR